MADSRVWVVRAGVNNEIASEVQKAGVVAIGWGEMGSLKALGGREDFKQRYRSCYTGDSGRKVGIGAGQLYRFVRQIQIGDVALTPIAASREVLIREVTGEYLFDPKVISRHYPNVRTVKPLKKVSRDDLTVPFRNTLGGLMSVFDVTAFRPEVEALQGREPSEEVPEPDEQPEFTPQEIQARADEVISDLLYQIDAYEFQDFAGHGVQNKGESAWSRWRD